MTKRLKRTLAKRQPGIGARLAALTLAASAAFAVPASVAAQQVPSADANPFSALVGERQGRREARSQRSKIERYVLASDDRAFLFEDRGGEARVKFLCGPSDQRLDCVIDREGPAAEIYLLSAIRAPRGDVIYKNAEGDTFLRIASYGGATVYWPGETQGAGASKSFGDDTSLALEHTSYETVLRRAQGGTALISALTGAPIVFDPGKLDLSTDHSVLADAVVTAAKGLKTVADDPTGARVIASRIGRVSFIRDTAPSVVLNENILEIRYVPDRDIRGRPSSASVAHYLEETL